MRLYTVQSLETVALLYKYHIYFPILEKCVYPKMGADEGYPHWGFVYEWMTAQYNKRRGHDFSSAPVWWYTQKREAIRLLMEDRLASNEVLLQADVPDDLCLLHDADLWEIGPFSGHHLGWMGHPMHLASNWSDNYDALSDGVFDAYQKNPTAMMTTWSEVFHIRKTDGTQRVHAVTPYIALGWLDPSATGKEKSQVE